MSVPNSMGISGIVLSKICRLSAIFLLYGNWSPSLSSDYLTNDLFDLTCRLQKVLTLPMKTRSATASPDNVSSMSVLLTFSLEVSIKLFTIVNVANTSSKIPRLDQNYFRDASRNVISKTLRSTFQIFLQAINLIRLCWAPSLTLQNKFTTCLFFISMLA